jgi:hypothetical protein
MDGRVDNPVKAYPRLDRQDPNLRPYLQVGHPRLRDLNVVDCYLCGESLSGRVTPDHIIPNSLYDKGAGNRPTLPTHRECNRAKSLDDEWFKRMVELMSAATDAQASEGAFRFFQKAEAEAQKAFLVGVDDRLRNYKLFRRLVQSVGGRRLTVTHQGRPVPQLAVGRENERRLVDYVGSLCQGLFVRNVPGATPGRPQVGWIQFAQAELTGEGASIMRKAIALIESSKAHNSFFLQGWGDRIYYAGSSLPDDPNFGFVVLQLYNSVAFLAIFVQAEEWGLVGSAD